MKSKITTLLIITIVVSSGVFIYNKNASTNEANIKSKDENFLRKNTLLSKQDSITSFFQEAYNYYPNIPDGLLEAISFNTTRLKHRMPNPMKKSCTGNPDIYGIMGLTSGGKNLNNNLLEISKISNFTQKELKENPRKNILGTAKWLNNKFQNEDKNIKDVIWDYLGFSDGSKNSTFLKNDFSLQVIKSMKKGVSLRGYIYSKPNNDIEINKFFEESFLKIYEKKKIELVYSKNSQSSDYPNATWVGSNCFNSRNGTSITDVVIHDMEGYFTYTVYTHFQNCSNQVSAHYCIRSNDGFVVQLVSEADRAWHIGNANSYAIGIEHEGFADDSSWYTTEMYNSSAELVIDITQSGYGISPTTCYNGPSNPAGQLDPQPTSVKIKGHCHYPTSINPNAHWDPGPNWDWNLYYDLINNGGNSPNPPTLQTPSNNSTNVSIPVDFDWSSVSGADNYRINVATSTSGFDPNATPMFTNTVLDQTTGSTSNYNNWSGAQPNTTYYWAVRVNVPGQGTATTGIHSFTTESGTANYPDLVIENMWTVPTNPDVGENVDLYVDIKNVGNQTANSISLDYKINNTTIGSDTHSSLAPSETRTEYYNNYVFNTSGTYNYCVYIDAVTNEQNTANNSYCINVNVGNSSSGDDFYVQSQSVTPTTVEAGSDIDVSCYQHYNGNSSTNLWSDLGYYLSTDTTFSSSSDLYLGDDSSSLSTSDTNDPESETVTIPAGTSAGTYYVLFVADYNNNHTETNESNNVAYQQITVTVPASDDFYVQSQSVTPTTVEAGSDIDVSCYQHYNGNSSTNLWSDLGYYLSTDTTFSSSSDVYLSDDSSSLSASDTNDPESETVTIPAGTSAGTYYVLFVADYNNNHTETNESNNVAYQQITVTVPLSIVDYEFQEQLAVYPNPTYDIINLKSDNNLNINKLVVYDLNGRIVKVKQANYLNNINISELANGIYILQVINDKNKKATFRIMKK